RAKAELAPPPIRISYAGDVVTALTEYGRISEDLVEVGVLGTSLVLAVVLLFFMRVRALAALGFTVACGTAWTFGATYLVLGHLNVATGFLFSIIAGNGINFGILYMARYFEERRGGKSAEDALRIAHERTAPSTLTVAMASAAAYGSLGASGFRVFRHFAVIGSMGMALCWISTALLLPSVLLLLERLSPFRGGDTSLWHRLRWRGLRYDALFGYLVQRAPRTLAFGGIALAVFGASLLLPYLKSDPMEYDVRRLHADVGTTSDIYRASKLTEELIGGRLDQGMVVLAYRVDQVSELKKTLMERRDEAPPDQKPFEAVHTLLDFVPDGQAEKIPVLMSIRGRLLKAKRWMKPEDWQKIEMVVPPEDLRPFTLAELPADLARPFSEKDGTRGRVVLIEPTAGIPDTDIKYLIRWADSFRETRLPNGEVLRGSGRAVIFADMLGSVQRDVPVAIALSLGMTLFVVVALFRNFRRSALVLGALLVGLSWMALFMVATNVKINFFNFVALPITFGIGVDYAVNFVRRCDSDPEQGVLGALMNTGGPIVLCSLTTVMGYSALCVSINQAIRGLGVLAVVGEIACLFAALLVLPAAMLLMGRGRPSLPPQVAIQSEPSS
ncbi:MAG TPA: MMPL family transporter, partial [Polyangiaceae bacterium]